MEWNPDALKMIWTLMGVIGLAFSTAIVRLFGQYHRAARELSPPDEDARTFSRDFLIGEAVRFSVQLLIVAAGVLALFTPPPRVKDLTILGIFLAIIFMLICLAAMFGSVHAYVSWRHRERTILLRNNIPLDAPPRFVVVMVRVVDAVERFIVNSLHGKGRS